MTAFEDEAYILLIPVINLQSFVDCSSLFLVNF
jgi:hypothetical protein